MSSIQILQKVQAYTKEEMKMPSGIGADRKRPAGVSGDYVYLQGWNEMMAKV